VGENTKIEWCDATFNPWFGCTKVSPACDHCYAEAMMDHRYGKVSWGAGEDRKRTSPSNWKQPYKWDREAAAAGKPATVFCLSLGDIWDNEVDPKWRNDALKVMEETPHLIWLLLSKRIGNAVKMCDPMAGNRALPENAALGATLVNQEEWDRDYPKLKHAGQSLGAKFTFASVEPMLGPIDARGDLPGWIIVGGESGKHARPMHPGWARSLRDQCNRAGVPYLLKQWGEWAPAGHAADPSRDPVNTVYLDDNGDQCTMPLGGGYDRAGANFELLRRVGKKLAGRLLDGVEHNGFPVMMFAGTEPQEPEPIPRCDRTIEMFPETTTGG
jgi:protein gp37